MLQWFIGRYKQVMDFTREANVFEVLRNTKGVKQLSFLKTSEDDFLASLYQQINSSTADYSSFGQTTAYGIVSIQNLPCDLSTLNAEKKSHEYLVSPYKEKCCNDAEVSYLNDMYKLLDPTLCIVKSIKNVSSMVKSTPHLTPACRGLVPSMLSGVVLQELTHVEKHQFELDK